MYVSGNPDRTQNIDELLLVSDHSMKGVRTIARLIQLITELKLVVKRQSVIINRTTDGLDPLIREELSRLNIEPAAVVPLDEAISEYDLKFQPLTDLPDTSPAVRTINELMDKLLGA